MTVGGWILWICLVVFIWIIAGVVWVGTCEISGKGNIVIIIIAVLLTFLILGFMLWWFNNTASGKRLFKSQRSNFDNGMERLVRVYDVNGELIESYDGKFDITYDNDRILFDDEKGKRHIIYYTTGTVLIDEE